MNPEAGCDRFADDLSRADPPSPELASHLAGCQACRETREAMDAVREVGSAFPAPDIDRLTARVLARSLPPAPASPPVGPSVSPVLLGVSLGLLIGAAGWWGLSQPPSPPKTQEGIPSEPGLVVIADGTSPLETGDGSRVTLFGPASAKGAPRRVEVFWGRAKIEIQPASAPMVTETAHCSISGSQGTFTCETSGTGTRLLSQDARLTVVSRPGGETFTLDPGQTRDIPALAAAVEVPGPDTSWTPATASGPPLIVPAPDREEGGR